MSIPDYIPLDLLTLRADVPLDCDLYIKKGHRYLLYRSSRSPVPFRLADAQRLVLAGATHLWIRFSEDDGASQGRLASLLCMPDEQLPPPAKAQLWYGSAMATAKRSIKGNAAPTTLRDVEGLINLTVDYLARSAAAFSAILSATLHDNSIHTHAVNVAVYSLGLGKSMGTLSDQELCNLGLAAFLHDVGKARVPKEVLLKPGPLSAAEWVMMKQHPEWGLEMLSATPDLPEEVVAAVSQHHERLDGSGYPGGLGGGNLHPFATIVSLVDAFDAMTSFRPYARARSAYDALSILKKDSGVKFDPGLFASLVLLLGDPRRAGCVPA